MNTRTILEQAKKERISGEALQAHVLWALISQIGRPYMTAGEVAKMVKQTSGVTPSAYQVKSQLEKLNAMNAAFSQTIRQAPLGPVRGYHASDNAIGLLLCYQYHFAKNTVLWDAVQNCVKPALDASIEVINAICKFNREMDMSPVVAK